MTKLYLSDIYVYPIKSLGGIHLEEAQVTEKGLNHDRRWMLLEADSGNFMTIRRFSEFLFFRVNLQEEGYSVEYRGEFLSIPFSIEQGNCLKTKVWDDDVEVIEGKDEWNQWFSQRLGKKCKLVYMPPGSRRLIKSQWGSQAVSFADGYPYLIIGKASLEALNNKLTAPIEMERFRPNLVFQGGQSYEEFNWSVFDIGDCRFQGLKPCARCVVTTYDLTTGEKGKEPLLTLSKQKIDNKLVFGQHATAMEHKYIKVGDKIIVHQYKDSPFEPLHQ